ncbi:GNAT family N-acetyltransferase [Uliginosibacterium paludis]|uniref:GNAT family N-acetyltransferase n=1 Tax=Uliginosibacterium paludis TaxID=1615952 RepID=UPI0031F68F54
MRNSDLASVHRIQCSRYPVACHEPQVALQSRLEAAPAFCFVAEHQGRTLAYVLAHPWRGPAPRLHERLAACDEPDHVFLHDLCVSIEAQGLACGRALFGAVEAAARLRAHERIRIVALEQAEGFWSRLGFQDEHQPAGEGYGRARLMARDVSKASAPT